MLDPKSCGPAASDGLPATTETVEGFPFRPHDPVWRIVSIDKLLCFNVAGIPAAAPLRSAIVEYLHLSVQKLRPVNARRDLDAVLGLLAHAAAQAGGAKAHALTAAQVISYDASVPRGRCRRRVSLLKDALFHMHAAGVGGLAPCLVGYLPHWHVEGQDVGRAVRTLSETEGALDDQEQRDLSAALTASFEAGLTSLRDYNLIRLMGATGVRPLSFAVAKAKDLQVFGKPDGTVAYVWHAALLKQRGVALRKTFFPLELDPGLGRAIFDQCVDSAGVARELGMEPGEAPIFFSVPRPRRQGLPELRGFAGHMDAAAVHASVVATVRRLAVVSQRTGRPLHASPVRWRRTAATNMFKAGASVAAVSAFLGQTCDTSALLYVEVGPAFVTRIDAAIGVEHQALASLWMSGPDRKRGEPRPGAKP